METVKVKELANLADKIIESGMSKQLFVKSVNKLDTSRVIKNILKNIKTLTSEELDCLDLVISVRSDQTLNNMRVMLREELESIKKDIGHIKKVVGCNGDA